jgi:PAS domain S-box-containing protein
LIANVRDYAIFMLDAAGHVATWNPGAEHLKQYRAEEIVGQHFSIFYPPEVAATGKCDAELVAAAETGRFEEEGWRVRKDGTRFWASVVINPVRDGDGLLVGFAKVTRDLTERRAAEAERLRLAQAQESVRLRDEFISIASHELKTPLTTVQLQVSALRHALANPATLRVDKLAARVHAADAQLQRMSKLIADLLDVSRAASGRLGIEPSEVDIAEVVREVVERMREDIAGAGCPLSLHIDAPIVGLWDRIRIDQVVTNLLTNALKYGGKAPIEVVTTVRDGQVLLRVRDQGIGIPPEDQDRIFERFERAAPSTNFGGLGLGLWIVRQLVEAMGGRIEVESAPGKGATFSIWLPRLDAR